eukprot:s165_g34.t1
MASGTSQVFHFKLVLLGDASVGKSCLVANRAVDKEAARTYADQNGLIYMETSAKTGQNVNELFNEIAVRLPRQLQERLFKEEQRARGFAVGQSGTSSAGCASSC